MPWSSSPTACRDSSTTHSGWPASASAPAGRSTSQPARSTTPTPCRSSPVSTSPPASSERMAAPAWIDNDAVVAGLAETHWGRAGATESLLCVTLGTGIGAVLIEAGRPRRAADGQHPEAGHIPVAGTGNPCYCGLPQCWEQVASRTALDRLRRSGEHEAFGAVVGVRRAGGQRPHHTGDALPPGLHRHRRQRVPTLGRPCSSSPGRVVPLPGVRPGHDARGLDTRGARRRPWRRPAPDSVASAGTTATWTSLLGTRRTRATQRSDVPASWSTSERVGT